MIFLELSVCLSLFLDFWLFNWRPDSVMCLRIFMRAAKFS